ncbi:retrovirus-related Pol polyprotein from transposon 297 [Trichonephila clavipes]|nr:retrovirus-related Pol polyprotein from transposon 297 [Trichonephila clavipes]
MLQEGKIRTIHSPYSLPVVLSRKNNILPPDSPEAYRFTIDYRKLNAFTKYPRYPLPVIDDLITNIPHTGIMSTLDLKSGYFQLAISPNDIEKTAFITRNGTFAFLRMPFGLSGAAPNFQKAIDIILKPVIGRFVMVYMEDVIITSSSFNEHIDHLNQVFALLRDAGLTLNKEKCHFACDKLKYLGLIISKEGIEPDNSKVKAIADMKPPRNNKEVSKFLGIAGWYQKFISHYANISGRLIPIVSNYPNEIVTLDLLGAYPASRSERHRFLLVITDHFPKWSELIPLRNASAQAIAKALFENYISCYGAPISLINDNGSQFISEVLEHLNHRLEIKHIKTVTYLPQANLTERVNRTLVQMIACFVEGNHENWDREISS